MRVSLVSTASCYPETDALAHLASLLLRRGDSVQVYSPFATAGLPKPLSDLAPVTGPSAAQSLALPAAESSDLFIYHYVAHDPILETLLALDRGVVVLWYQPTGPLETGHTVPDSLVRLASASDLVVVGDAQAARSLRDAGAAEPERLAIVPPSVSLTQFAPELPDLALRSELDLLGNRVLLTCCAPDGATATAASLALLEDIRAQVEGAVLAVVQSGEAGSQSVPEMLDAGDVHVLPQTADLRPYYALADIFLTPGSNSASQQRALEAMASGLPVLSLELMREDLTGSAIRLLNDDRAYGEAVRHSLHTAANSSLEAFAQGWGAVIAQSCGWLPVRLASGDSAARVEPAPVASVQSEVLAEALPLDAFGIDIEQLKSMAGVTLRDYEVRSPTPFFGPFIAWVRRNLTSHLREPYVDPTLDRQEVFNLRAASILEELATRLAAYKQAAAQHAVQPTSVDPQVYELLAQVEGFIDTVATDDATRAQAGVIRSALAEIRSLLRRQSAGSLPPDED